MMAKLKNIPQLARRKGTITTTAHDVATNVNFTYAKTNAPLGDLTEIGADWVSPANATAPARERSDLSR